MAVVPPIPKASVNTAAAVKMGDNLNCRNAYRKLPGRLCMEHLSILYAVLSRQVPKSCKLADPVRTPTHFRRVLLYGRFKESFVTELQRAGWLSGPDPY